jgi:N-acylneuraminate cytidylyltransferase
LLNQHPLIAYTIAPALASGIFDRVVVSTDSEEIASIARHYGAEVPFLRPPEMAEEKSPDIQWVIHALNQMQAHNNYDCFSILRPTSPFRTPEMLQRAWQEFQAESNVDSLRAVEKCSQHPCKMWKLSENNPRRMEPLIEGGPKDVPWHSTPYQALPPVYAQNASLEICWTHVPLQQGTIAGQTLMPFFTQGYEGFDINTQEDWWVAERLVSEGLASLPDLLQPPYGK